VLLHADTAHAGGPNISSEIRKMVYFRVKFKRIPPRGSAATRIGEKPELLACWEDIERAHMTDLWVDMPGILESLKTP
jgi:hypothetical protein